MKSIHLKLGIAALCVSAGAAYWYYSPLIALHQMRTAAYDNDADSFNARVDYPRLRASTKAQLNAAMHEQVKPRIDDENDVLAKAGADFGKMLSLALSDQVIDAMVTPDAVLGAFKLGLVKSGGGSRSTPDTVKPDPKYTSERIGLNTYIVHLESGKPGVRGLSLVMERHGFASWKLAEVRAPTPAAAPN